MVSVHFLPFIQKILMSAHCGPGLVKIDGHKEVFLRIFTF